MKSFFSKKRVVSFLLAFLLLITTGLPTALAVEEVAPAVEEVVVEETEETQAPVVEDITEEVSEKVEEEISEEVNEEVSEEALEVAPEVAPAKATAAPQEERYEIIAMDAPWRYNDEGKDLGADWAKNIDASKWKEGKQPLGFGDEYDEVDGITPLRTEVGFGPDPSNKHRTTYFEKTVDIPNLDNYKGLEYYIHVDDGAVVYLNGTEILRKGLKAGVNFDFNTYFKFKPKEETDVIALKDLQGLLVEGKNVFTAEVHQSSKSSSDLWFEFAVTAVKTDTYVAPAQQMPKWMQDNQDKILEVNAHVGGYATWARNITWTQFNDRPCKFTLIDHYDGGRYDFDITGQSNGTVYTYVFPLTGLYPESKYSYIIDNGVEKVEGSFVTGSATGSDKPVRFAMIADPQVANPSNAKSTGAIFNQLNILSKDNPFDFLYIAGDHTDTRDNELQWFKLFHNDGATPNSTQEFFLNNTLVSTQGNHDHVDFMGHITQTDMGGNGVYDVDYGQMKFIIMNNASYNDPNTNPDFQEQIKFLKEKVAEAKANGQWTIVGFHKPIYTGASHIDDGDVIEYRKLLNPIFTELGVDMVLAGHDHVYSRGFIDKDGNLVNNLDKNKSTPEFPVYNRQEGAPLHFVSEHAGGLKWYWPVDYNVTSGDPIAPAYGFLEINSAEGKHPILGEAVLGNTPSGKAKDQTYTIIEVAKDKVTFVTYKMHYDTKTDTITQAPYIYDQFAITRTEEEALPIWAKDVKNEILEVNTHVGEDAVTSTNLTWTQMLNKPAKLKVLDPAGKAIVNETIEGVFNGNVYNTTYQLKNLQAETEYRYTITTDTDEVSGSFTTAKPDHSPDKIRFAMIADPQIRDDKRANATGALFNGLSQLDPLDFLFIAGDHTDRGYNNDQFEWFNLFHNGGQYPNATQNFLLENTLVSAQGNHDVPDLNGNIFMPDEAGKGVYDADFGQVKFIILNNASYDTDDLENNEAFQKQVAFLKEKVAEAKSNNQWIIVGYHKPIYTGASHIWDGDVIAYRKALNPIFTELEVDMVLGGHDHVYSRGFINANGELKTSLNKDRTFRKGYPVYNAVNGAPLHLVGEHAGGLKWYNPVDYNAEAGGPIVPDYGFLDVNSAEARHPEMAPEGYEGWTSSQLQDQTYIEVELDQNEAVFTVYKLHYDMETDTVTNGPEVYEKFAVLKTQRKSPGSKLPPSPGMNLDNTGITVNGYTKNSVYVRPEKGSDEYVEILPAGTKVEGKEDGAWVRFKKDGKDVYVAKFILTSTLPTSDVNGYLKSNLYVRPSKNSGKSAGILPAGKQITGVREGAWTKIKHNGKDAYIASNFIIESNVIHGKTTSAIFVRPEKNSSAKEGILSKGSDVKGVLDGAWVRIFYNNQTAYIARNFVK